MNKISPKSIQLFVAGALALTGFRDLFWLPFYFVYSKDTVLIVSSILTGIALVLGISILRGFERAVHWAIVYLALSVGLALAIMFFSLSHTPPPRPPNFAWKTVGSIITPLTLLVLLLWSRSKYFQDDHAA